MHDYRPIETQINYQLLGPSRAFLNAPQLPKEINHPVICAVCYLIQLYKEGKPSNSVIIISAMLSYADGEPSKF